jgi:hypothetical protein
MRSTSSSHSRMRIGTLRIPMTNVWRAGAAVSQADRMLPKIRKANRLHQMQCAVQGSPYQGLVDSRNLSHDVVGYMTPARRPALINCSVSGYKVIRHDQLESGFRKWCFQPRFAQFVPNIAGWVCCQQLARSASYFRRARAITNQRAMDVRTRASNRRLRCE